MSRPALGRLALLLACAFCGSPCGRTMAQNRSADHATQIDSIKRQIDALRKELETVESARSTESSKVGVIGSGGARSGRNVPREIEVRIYDLSDLFTVAPPYPATFGSDVGPMETPVFDPGAGGFPRGTNSGGGMGGGGFGGGGGFFDQSRSPGARGKGALPQVDSKDVAAGAKSSVDELVSAIQHTISPDQWDVAGGDSSIARLGTSLVINAEPQVHEQVENLLAQLRRRWGTLRTVSVDCWWVWLSRAELRRLLPGDGRRPVRGTALAAYGLVEEAEFERLLDDQTAGTEEQGPRVHEHLVITGYNGQTVSGVSGTEQAIVSDLEPVVASPVDDRSLGQVAYQLRQTVIQQGVALQLTPLVNSSGRIVVLDLRSRVALIDPEVEQRAPHLVVREEVAGPERVKEAIDRTKMQVQRLSTTMRVPVGQPVLIGGMSFPAEEERRLYLFARVEVQELRDDVDSPQGVSDDRADEGPASNLPVLRGLEEEASEDAKALNRPPIRPLRGSSLPPVPVPPGRADSEIPR